MFGIHDLGIFLTTCIALNLTPGPDTFYILGRSLSQGRNAGLASALGISTGSLIHSLAAAFGLSALLATSAQAFLIVKLVGAAYLVFLGAKMLLSRADAPGVTTSFATSGFFAVYRQGMLTNVLNPKVALFFLAFVPQFISTDSTNKFAAFLTLGLCFVTTATIWYIILGWFSAHLGNRLRSSPSFSTILNRTAGALFVALGIRLATTK